MRLQITMLFVDGKTRFASRGGDSIAVAISFAANGRIEAVRTVLGSRTGRVATSQESWIFLPKANRCDDEGKRERKRERRQIKG